MLILALLAVQAAPQPGALKTFGDWTVACDNTRLCTATSLPIKADDSGTYDDNSIALTIVRAAGAGGELRIETDGGGSAVMLQVDGRKVARGTPGSDGTVFTGAAVLEAVRALANGKEARVMAGGGMVGGVSLAGLSATLRYIDAEQGRAGTVTALVARGTKPASAVPPARPMPRIASVRPNGQPVRLTGALNAAMIKLGHCEDETGPSDLKTEVYALGGGRSLALVPCGAGAYNFASVPFVITAGKPALARFDSPPGFTAEENGVPLLVNAAFEPTTGQLSSFSKGRGLGDCGSSEVYVWDGTRFRMIEARQMGECRGSTNWLRTWVAMPEPR